MVVLLWTRTRLARRILLSVMPLRLVIRSLLSHRLENQSEGDGESRVLLASHLPSPAYSRLSPQSLCKDSRSTEHAALREALREPPPRARSKFPGDHLNCPPFKLFSNFHDNGVSRLTIVQTSPPQPPFDAMALQVMSATDFHRFITISPGTPNLKTRQPDNTLRLPDHRRRTQRIQSRRSLLVCRIHL